MIEHVIYYVCHIYCMIEHVIYYVCHIYYMIEHVIPVHKTEQGGENLKLRIVSFNLWFLSVA